MPTIIRTNAKHKDFVALVQELDAYLAITDGSEHAFYDQYNKLDDIQHAVMLYDNEVAVSCGAIKELYPDVMEVKRMFTQKAHRGKGYASAVLEALELWAKELFYKRCILETGKRQEEAIAFYKNMKYVIIPNYGQYVGMENSVCFEKEL
jgi:GNAT superfamily N-acetyltransferase